MDQQPVKAGHAENESNDQAEKKAIGWSHVFDWGFWTGHTLAVFAMFLGGIFLAAITNFPGGNPKTLWWLALGLWVFLGAIIWWVFSGIIARMEGRELLTSQELESRDQKYRDSIQSRLDALEAGIGDAKRQIALQGPRMLRASQREAIKKALLPFRGQEVQIQYLFSDTEAGRYAQDFMSVFTEAGWKSRTPENLMFPLTFHSVVVCSAKEEKLEDVMPAALVLHKILIDLGVTKDDGMFHFIDDEDTPSGVVFVRIGARPPAIE